MSKKRKSKSPRAPTVRESTATWLCTASAYNILVGDGYRPLSQCPEVQMCVAVYAELISSMTLHLMQNTEKGDVRVRNELARKLDINPHPLMTRKTWMYNIVWTMMLSGDGNQVTYPVYTSDGLLDRLEPLKPSSVAFMDMPGGYSIRYGDKTFSPDEVLHFVMNPDPEKPWLGTGYRPVLRDVVKGLRQAGATKQKLLESPAPSLIVNVDGLVEEFNNYEGRQKLRGQYIDDRENGEPWIIPAEAVKVTAVKPLTLHDLAIEANIELDKKTVAGIIGVPPFLVGVGDFNAEEYNNFISSRIMPRALGIQQELTRKTLIAPNLFWRFNPRSLYSYSLSDIIDAGSEMIDRMAMRRNEWRDWIGMEPDPDMDELLALENYLPADRLGDQKKLIKGGEIDG